MYLTDFGLTKRAASATGATTADHFLGTLDYVAPEQIRGEDVDGRADVYALACVAYTLLASHPPFDHDDDCAQLWAHMFEEPPRLSDEGLDVPPAVELVILAGMAKQREDRPSSCGSLVAMMYGDEQVDAEPVPRPADGSGATDQESDDGSLTEAVPRTGPGHGARSFRRVSQRSGVPQQGRPRRPGRGVWLVGLGVGLVLLVVPARVHRWTHAPARRSSAPLTGYEQGQT